MRLVAMTANPQPENIAGTTSALSIQGDVARPLVLRHADLAALDAKAQVADVGALVPGKHGRAVRLSALAEKAGVRAGARHVHIASADPAFAVSVPIGEVIDTGLVVFEVGGKPLASDKGGPFRLLVPGHADECVNVKQLVRLEFSGAPGRDTRPVDDAEHARMHASGCANRSKPKMS
jgi:DMSO/TMAO reductase YedYZ molybdopterin-dependent catalytic subunit